MAIFVYFVIFYVIFHWNLTFRACLCFIDLLRKKKSNIDSVVNMSEHD